MQDTLVESRPAEASQPPTRGRGAAIFNLVAGWVLLVSFVASFGAFVLQGSVPASHYDLMDRLESDAARGATTSVEVVHWGPDDVDVVSTPMAPHGYMSVDVRWRDGLVRRHTEYMLASSEAEARAARDQNESLGRVVVAPDTLVEEWSEVQPNMSVEQAEWDGAMGANTEIFDVQWFGPSWALFLGGLVAGLGTLTRLVVGPQPWRATRWAWAWPVLLAWPIGVPAFLLFSGATGLFAPSNPTKRIGGLASLILTVVVVWLIESGLT